MQQEANVMKTTTSTKRHNLTRIAMYCSIMYSGATIGAESVEYDPTFLMGGNASSIDVSRYSDGNPTLPGVYDVSIYVNEQPVANLEIPFIAIPDKKNAQACITLKIYYNCISRHPRQTRKILSFFHGMKRLATVLTCR